MSRIVRVVADVIPRTYESVVRTSMASRDILASAGWSFERGCGSSCDQQQQPADVRLMQLRLRGELEACVAASEIRWPTPEQPTSEKLSQHTHALLLLLLLDDDDALPSCIILLRRCRWETF